MSRLEAYIESVCTRLRANPAEAEDIREELRAHLEELVRSHRARGAGEEEATDLAISSFGSAARLHSRLDRVHDGDAWWVVRLKGLGLGVVIGGLIALAAPLGGHAEFVSSLVRLPAEVDPARAQALVNGAVAGGLIGVLSAGGRGLLVGWAVGTLLWLTESTVHWVACATGGAVDAGANLLGSVLLSPLVGGLFGVAVGIGCIAVLSVASQARPQIQ